MTTREPQYSDPWTGRDGRQWREVNYWNGRGWQSFLQVLTADGWVGW